jgi:hypothetical protein
MSDGASNEAKIVISTDWASFKDFLEGSKKGLDDVGAKGRSTFGDLGNMAAGLAKGGLVGALAGFGVAYGKEVYDAVISPLKKGFGELIADAAKLRKEITGTAIAAGQDFKQFESQINDLRRKTGEGTEPIKGFIRSVAGQTGDWQGAFGAVEGAKKEALARGYGSVSEMGEEVGTLKGRWKVEDVEKFYNKQRSGAKALGLNENFAAETAAKVRGIYEESGMSAEQVGRWSNTLLKGAGGDRKLALEMAQEFYGAAQGAEGRGQLEKTLGLKQGALINENGGTDIARAIDLMMKFQRGKRGQKGLEFVARQHFSPRVAQKFSRNMEEITAGYEAQLWADDGNPLSEAAGRFYGSKQGKSELAGQNRAIEDEQAGKWWLDYKERVADLVGGGGSEKWLRPLKNPKGIRTILGEDPEALERHYAEGRERDRKAREGMAKRQAAERAGAEPSFWRPTGSAPTSSTTSTAGRSWMPPATPAR